MCVCKASPEPVWLSSISAGLWGFKPRKDSGVLASPGGDRPKATQSTEKKEKNRLFRALSTKHDKSTKHTLSKHVSTNACSLAILISCFAAI